MDPEQVGAPAGAECGSAGSVGNPGLQTPQVLPESCSSPGRQPESRGRPSPQGPRAGRSSRIGGGGVWSPGPVPSRSPVPRPAALTYLCTSVRTRLQSMAPPAAPASAQRPRARLSAPMGPGPSVAARPRPGHGLGAPGGAGGGRGPSALMPGPARGGRLGGGRSAAVAARPGCWRWWGCGLKARQPGRILQLLCSSALLLSSALLPSPPGSSASHPLGSASGRRSRRARHERV